MYKLSTDIVNDILMASSMCKNTNNYIYIVCSEFFPTVFRKNLEETLNRKGIKYNYVYYENYTTHYDDDLSVERTLKVLGSNRNITIPALGLIGRDGKQQKVYILADGEVRCVS